MDRTSGNDPGSSVAVVGLGYVGLEIAVAFADEFETIGFDTDEQRVEELREGHDRNGEVGSKTLRARGENLTLSTDPKILERADTFVVAVPTKVDQSQRPNLSHLRSASREIGQAFARRSDEADRLDPLVVFESTVYPGCTEEVCVPEIEEASGLSVGEDFSVGYSPERINPGDEEHGVRQITKIVAAGDRETERRLESLYGRILEADTYVAADIQTAEAAKVIENVQRDLNIALMNELAVLFDRLDLDTRNVLDAAGTKWNFLDFHPGLVGGHCIPVDPYYLTHKAEEVGHHPEIILAGRRVNDGTARFVARRTVKELIQRGHRVKDVRILVAGVAFKENVANTQNSQVPALISELESFEATVHVHDPLVPREKLESLGLTLCPEDPWAGPSHSYDGLVLAVPHDEYLAMDATQVVDPLRDSAEGPLFVDVQSVFDREALRSEDVEVWRL